MTGFLIGFVLGAVAAFFLKGKIAKAAKEKVLREYEAKVATIEQARAKTLKELEQSKLDLEAERLKLKEMTEAQAKDKLSSETQQGIDDIKDQAIANAVSNVIDRIKNQT